MSMNEKAGQASALRLVGIDRESVVTASARMRHMIRAAPQRTLVPSVVKIKDQRRMDANRWLQTLRRLPSPITDSRNTFTVGARRMQRHAPAVAGQRKTFPN